MARSGHGLPNPAKCEPLGRSEGRAHHRALGRHVTGRRVTGSDCLTAQSPVRRVLSTSDVRATPTSPGG